MSAGSNQQIMSMLGDQSKLGQSNSPYNRPFSYAPGVTSPQAHQFFDGTGPGGQTPAPVDPGMPPPFTPGAPTTLPPPGPPTGPVVRPPPPVLGGVTSVGPAGPYPGAPGTTTPTAPTTPPGAPPPPPQRPTPGLDNNNKMGQLISDGGFQPQGMNYGNGAQGGQAYANFMQNGGMGNLPLRDQLAQQNFGGDQGALNNWVNTQSYGVGGQMAQHNGETRPWILQRLQEIYNKAPATPNTTTAAPTSGAYTRTGVK
jgi:hypothetical protein